MFIRHLFLEITSTFYSLSLSRCCHIALYYLLLKNLIYSIDNLIVLEKYKCIDIGISRVFLIEKFTFLLFLMISLMTFFSRNVTYYRLYILNKIILKGGATIRNVGSFRKNIYANATWLFRIMLIKKEKITKSPIIQKIKHKIVELSLVRVVY